MKLYEILKGSEYSLCSTKTPSSNWKTKSLNEPTKKGKAYLAVLCLIRNKEIKLTPEEVVRQLYTAKLITDYGYPKQEIANRVRESFALRDESKRLLNLAKTAVSTAIEQGESATLELLNVKHD